MSPRVRLAPDGRAVVLVGAPGPAHWVALSARSGVVEVELLSDEQTAGWPEYVAPTPEVAPA